eukprot:693234-Ditylum_brightwellii.AAC.1
MTRKELVKEYLDMLLTEPVALLFLGYNWGDQFLKGFESLLAECDENIWEMGYDQEDLGTQNICNGVTTYTSPGPTPSLGGLPVMSHQFIASHPQFTCLKSGDEDTTSFASHQTILEAQIIEAIASLFPSASLAAGFLFTL